jgi:hypothetical protein
MRVKRPDIAEAFVIGWRRMRIVQACQWKHGWWSVFLADLAAPRHSCRQGEMDKDVHFRPTRTGCSVRPTRQDGANAEGRPKARADGKTGRQTTIRASLPAPSNSSQLQACKFRQNLYQNVALASHLWYKALLPWNGCRFRQKTGVKTQDLPADCDIKYAHIPQPSGWVP